MKYITGVQDSLYLWDELERVPTFWSGSTVRAGPRSRIPLQADAIALAVAAVFGVVHCAAWAYAFLSATEKTIWRYYSLFHTIMSIIMGVAFTWMEPFDMYDPSGRRHTFCYAFVFSSSHSLPYAICHLLPTRLSNGPLGFHISSNIRFAPRDMLLESSLLPTSDSI